ncbi:UNVERIFIED_CONTAM: hypothetical protein GTU68_067286 [Idotea baltica]|nr:hypothetical protein [Idotea baltica]
MIFVDRTELDITDSKAVHDRLADGHFSHLINCAAYTAVDKAESEPELCYKVNAEAAKNLAEACEKHNCILIHISSDYVYHPEDNIPLDEDASCSPKGVYAKSKLEGEEHIRNILREHLIIRTSWVYSSYGNNFLKTMLRLGKEKSELSIVNDQIGSPTYAEDIAKVILEIVRQGKNWGTYNFSNLGYTSWASFAAEIFRLQNLKVNIKEIPSIDYPTPAPRPLNSRLIKSKIADTFDLHLNHWKTSLKKCLEELTTE